MKGGHTLRLPDIPPLCDKAAAEARARLDSLAKLPGSLGRLEDLAVRLAGMTGDPRPLFPRKAVVLFAGDHAIARQGLSATGEEVTALQVINFVHGGGAINAFARNAGALLSVVDVAVARELPELSDLAEPAGSVEQAEAEKVPPASGEPAVRFFRRKIRLGCRDFSLKEDGVPVRAMSLDEARAAVEVGLELAEKEAERGVRLLAAGEMGVGNTTPSSALACLFTGAPPELVTGAGSGLASPMIQRKVEILRGALSRHFPRLFSAGHPNPDGPDADPLDTLSREGGLGAMAGLTISGPDLDPLDALSRVGGAEIGAMAGLMIGGAARRIPVVVDGFIAGAAAALAVRLCPPCRDYLVGSHLSTEPGHRLLLRSIGVEPFFDFGLRLGEGTGAALFFPIIDAAVRVLHEMATLDDLAPDLARQLCSPSEPA